MKRTLTPLLVVALLLVAPVATHAQSCNPSGANTCPTGSSCKDLTGRGQYFCTSDGTGCSPACTGGQVCNLGKCVTPSFTAGGNTSGGTGAGANTGGGTGVSGNTVGGSGVEGNTPGGTGAGGGLTLQNPLKFNSLPELLDAILQAVVQLGAIVLTVMLIWVGFLFVSAQGNPEKVSTARSALLWTIIGGLILLGAEGISKVIEATVTSITS